MQMDISRIKIALVIPSYNELLALPIFLQSIKYFLNSEYAVIVVDDSDSKVSIQLESACREILTPTGCAFLFRAGSSKSGRGRAVRRGFELAIETFPNLENLIECDSDGSHLASDIECLISNAQVNEGLIIGSRYLPNSQIIGWPLSRIIFSKLLNFAIPKLINSQVTDITNGLRMYSKSSVEHLCTLEQKSAGFIYLSESLIHLENANFEINEIATTFINRTIGESSVTYREIRSSLLGLVALLVNRK